MRGELQQLGDERRFALITSYVHIRPLAEAGEGAQDCEIEGLKVAAVASGHEKCPRCWHRREDVGSSAGHPPLHRGRAKEIAVDMALPCVNMPAPGVLLW